MKTIFQALSIFLILTSCVSFERKLIKSDFTKISSATEKSIDGKYSFKGYENSSSLQSKPDQSIGVARMLDLNNSDLDDCDYLEIKSKTEDQKNFIIDFIFSKNDAVKHSIQYKATLKNGILLLKNRTRSCSGIPYFLGGCEISQSRIGLTADNNLFIQNYNENNGSFLFLMWAGYTMNYVEKYQRIQ